MTDHGTPQKPLPNALLWVGIVVLAVVIIVVGVATFMRSKSDKPPVGTEMVQLTPAEGAVGADTAPENQWIEWDASKGPSEFKVAGYEIRFSSDTDEGLQVPVMTVTAPNGQKTQVHGEAGSRPPSARFAVVQMDAASDAKQVLFSSFSFGAHCCTMPYLLELTDNGWRTISMGAWDGDQIPLPRDVDGDGQKEFVLSDQSFLYAFSSYADSYAPIAVYAVRDARFVDVSAQPKYRKLFTDNLADMRKACEQGGNGPCAGYAATAARAGHLDAAWPIILRNTQDSDWSNPAPCRQRGATDCDLDSQTPYETYAESLQWFLGDHGYTHKVFERRNVGNGPSFSCAAARTAAERMICANPALRESDAEMAEAYTRAHALSPDRAALARSQNAFLRQRDTILEPKLMLLAYQNRIEELDYV